MKIQDISGDGIIVSPGNTNSDLLAQAGKSTFVFCDAETVLNILPGEEHHFFGHNDGSDDTDCKRVFATAEDYVIRFEIKANNYASQTVCAEIYDGVSSEDFKKLFTYSTNRNTEQVRS